MRILAIDTSCGAASVAVVEGGMAEPLAVMTKRMTRGHAEALAPMTAAVIGEVEGGAASLGAIGVTVGPGSFTGIRIGLALARAMGMALEVPVIGVSTLVAFAAPLLAQPRAGIILSAIDAHLYVLAVIGVLSSVVGAYYYLRIVKLMYFDEPAKAFDRPIGREMQAVLVVTALAVLLFFAWPALLTDGADAVAAALFTG